MRLLLRFIVCHVMIFYLSPLGVYVTINACLKGPSVPQSELRYRLNYQQEYMSGTHNEWHIESDNHMEWTMKWDTYTE